MEDTHAFEIVLKFTSRTRVAAPRQSKSLLQISATESQYIRFQTILLMYKFIDISNVGSLVPEAMFVNDNFPSSCSKIQQIR